MVAGNRRPARRFIRWKFAEGRFDFTGRVDRGRRALARARGENEAGQRLTRISRIDANALMICAEGATEISPGLLVQRKSYPGKSSHKIILPLLAERGEGRGEESKF